ncbi:hypothetical protein OESDEN_20159 [Oesophagostomum dentatum]|uniref:Uncharacterized protein n=1 Tax=Oesophagostomum dentatum TaxID=61180 RepID=A0A0B1S9J8_OESDE|nr:hypothetical protein OESDEN_20159 [Oesophagostomum dentatum]
MLGRIASHTQRRPEEYPCPTSRSHGTLSGLDEDDETDFTKLAKKAVHRWHQNHKEFFDRNRRYFGCGYSYLGQNQSPYNQTIVCTFV